MIRTEDIIAATAEHYGVDVRYMKAGSRCREHVYPRHVAIAVMRRMTKLSMPQIGVRFGHREHTTILHALRRVAIRERDDLKTAEAIAAITEAAQRRFDCRRYRALLELATRLARLCEPQRPVKLGFDGIKRRTPEYQAALRAQKWAVRSLAPAP